MLGKRGVDWMTFDTICKYCGGECYDDEMYNSSKCKTCFVQECSHVNTYKELGNYAIQHKVEILETCDKCKCFRTITLFYTGTNVIVEDWDHDEVHVE